MIIISAVIIMMTVVMVLANIIGIIACRFGAASTEFCSTHRLVYYLVSSDMHHNYYVCVCGNYSILATVRFHLGQTLYYLLLLSSRAKN